MVQPVNADEKDEMLRKKAKLQTTIATPKLLPSKTASSVKATTIATPEPLPFTPASSVEATAPQFLSSLVNSQKPLKMKQTGQYQVNQKVLYYDRSTGNMEPATIMKIESPTVYMIASSIDHHCFYINSKYISKQVE